MGAGCCSPANFGFSHAKPPLLSSVSDSQWNVFQGKVQGIASAMKSELPATAILLVAVALGFALALIPQFVGVAADKIPRPLLFINVPLLLLWGAVRYWILEFNKKKDKEISEACAEFGRALGSQFTIFYRTENTGFCKAKRARTLRGVAIQPSTAQTIGAMTTGMPQTQTMQVQVPAGAPPGTMLQVMSPDGQTIQAAVPPGVMPGEAFTIQIPPQQPPVQATIVESNVAS